MRNYDYMEYHRSIAAELKASQDRVRYFIGNRHWGEDGRFKELLLMNYLKKVLPSNVSIGTGFVRNGDRITSQIDLIIYDNSIPSLFSEGDFVVVLPESVLGIVEVKSNIRAGKPCANAIEKADANGIVINKEIFNGIFGYESTISFSDGEDFAKSVKQALLNSNGYINHISFGPNHFMRYWPDGNPNDLNKIKCFSFYELYNLSFGYFISNLIEAIHIQSRNQSISNNMRDFLYPIENGKESKRLHRLELKLDM